MERVFLSAGALSGLLAVALGAFAAHGLKHKLAPELLASFQTGARYQMVHALALLAVAWRSGTRPGRLVSAAGWLFLAGTLLFSGSLYLLALSGRRWLGAVTPFGGLSFMAGWALLALSAWSARAPH